MNDAHAATTMSISSTICLLEEQQLHNAQKRVYSNQNQLEGQHTLQSILVVEDDPTLATLEAEVLASHGYTVVIVHDGELAIATLRTFIPDLVVLDLELIGNLNGWDVLQALRSYTTVPVLFTSSSPTTIRKYMRSLGETKGTLDHLPKPYPMQTFLKRVQRMLMIASH